MSALRTDGATLGLQRSVVPTAAGHIVVHHGREGGDVATILLHGAAASWTTWTPLIAEGDAASDGGRREPLTDVIAIDLPGWGGSAGPVPDIAVVSCAIAAVARSLGYRQWRLIGHSLGGFIALDVAARFPQNTVAVGLVSPSGSAIQRVLRNPILGAAALPAFSGMLLAMRMLRGLGSAAVPFLNFLRRSGALRVLARPLFRHPHAIDPSVSDALADEIRPQAFLAAAEQARTYETSLWNRISVPVRSVHGEHDVFVGAGDSAAMRRRIRDFDDVGLPGAGHYAAVERPGEVRAALADVFSASAPVLRAARNLDNAGRIGIKLHRDAGKVTAHRVGTASSGLALDLNLPPAVANAFDHVATPLNNDDRARSVDVDIVKLKS
ncbi:pimeloyl-ACP methyl ester carboxylesterase [Microbacterium endophyticum]|uniref:Pimeloyl-ACP methyl ester carboxylesterase n=1 Tax=Microbacterium endophyticum TaxID=1526412 RepID=A0A7W4V2H9_9MICO|nr:pimeloyl-ACP methyl ester carboxylesterase [Microbacterium endophyticum]NIK35375.1 pimeloyl-ACP methyl ester carboxylesterase [Microbacterium endophyticum]